MKSMLRLHVGLLHVALDQALRSQYLNKEPVEVPPPLYLGTGWWLLRLHEHGPQSLNQLPIDLKIFLVENFVQIQYRDCMAPECWSKNKRSCIFIEWFEINCFGLHVRVR